MWSDACAKRGTYDEDNDGVAIVVPKSKRATKNKLDGNTGGVG